MYYRLLNNQWIAIEKPEVPLYNDIEDIGRDIIVYRAADTEPFHLVNIFNVKMQVGINKQNRRIYIRSLVYPKSTYNLETISEKEGVFDIAKRTDHCPYCKDGVEFFIPTCTDFDKYSGSITKDQPIEIHGEKNMGILDSIKSGTTANLDTFGDIAGILVARMVNKTTWAPIVGWGLLIAKLGSRFIPGIKMLDRIANPKNRFLGSIVGAVMIGTLSYVGGAGMAGGFNLESIRAKARNLIGGSVMSGGSGALRRIGSAIGITKMSGYAMPVTGAPASAKDDLFATRTKYNLTR